jgi:hypothetical protein
MSESKDLQPSADASLRSSSSQQPTELPLSPNPQAESIEQYYQSISASYEKLTEMHAALKREKEHEVAGWKR